jgi:Zeta toxin
MKLTVKERKIQEEAINYVNKNKEKLVKKFILDKRPFPIDLLTFFMAGAPGAGKTEFSKRYIQRWMEELFEKIKRDKKINKILSETGANIERYDSLFIRIDVDEIREFLPQYQKTNVKSKTNGNAHIIQKAANKGLDILRKYCLDNKISFLHDGTFGNYGTLKKIIKKSLRKKRSVEIFYIYISPVSAWDFTQKRECVEGRNIRKDKFIEQFFNSMRNIEKVKEEFGKQVKIHCVIKNEANKVVKIRFNEPSVENFLELCYNKNIIKKYSKRDLINLI